MRRVQAARRLFPQMYFDADRCEAGIEAISFYHEKRDEERNVGLGPAHDWSSHGADAFGLIAVARPIILGISENDNDDDIDRYGSDGRSEAGGY